MKTKPMKNLKLNANGRVMVLATAASMLLPGYRAAANEVDLVANFSGSILADVGGTALFERAAEKPFGTGLIDPFLRLSSTGQTSLANTNIEQAYNTDGRLGNNGGQAPLDALSDPNFTRSLQLGDLGVVTKNGVDYYFFELDANEPDSATQRLLSIDNIRIYTAGVADGGDSITTDITTLGTLRFALNDPNVTEFDSGTSEPDNWVKISADHNFSDGSGQSDMYAYIPVTAFAGAAATDYVYFYNLNGVHYSAANLDGTAAQGGFEEWRTQTGSSTRVPDGGSAIALLGMSLLGVEGIRRRLIARRS